MLENNNSSDALQLEAIDVEKETNEIALKVKNSPEVLEMAAKLDVSNAESVMNFGQETATEVSRFADRILHSIETTKVEDSGALLNQLNNIMNKFDIKDFEEKKPGFFSRFMRKAKDSIDNLFKKYHTMGGEIDKVYVQLKKYESEIKQSNNDLEQMFDKNLEYYESLEKHICAGKLVIQDFNNRILPELQNKAETSGDQIDKINLSNAMQLVEMLEQRLYDLELAQNVALQTMPQIKLIQKGNYNLIRKINSAFIVTIPIFKQSLTQAITLKRQAVQAKAMAALDERTNELILKNAENTALQSKLTAKLASGGSINIETLEKTWETIVKGIEETRQIENEAKQSRIDGQKKLAAIQKDFESKVKNK